jgi:hypothetical protein
MVKKKKKKKKGNKDQKNYSTIDEHQMKGKKLVPPLLQLPNLQMISWLNERLPEMLWAALLITGLERDDALNIFRRVVEIVKGVNGVGPVDVTHTGIMNLPADLRDRFLQIMCRDIAARNALRPLLLLKALPGFEHWARVLNVAPVPSDWEALKVAVAHTLDHQSQEATDCRWVRVLAKVVAGQLKLPSPELAMGLLYYPNYGDMREIRSFIRAIEGCFSFDSKSETNAWPAAFWEQCWKDTECETGFIHYEAGEIKPATTRERVSQVRKALVAHYKQTIRTTDIDAEHEGTFGLAAYALAILDELLRFGNSTAILGRMGLRALLECYVTLTYLSASTDKNVWQAYRMYGAGQAKLAFLKLDDETVTPPDYVRIETLKSLANEDRWLEFTEINVGHWDNSNLRSISEKAGVKAEYDRYYPWTSGFIHGNWAAVRNAAFDLCINPLHRLHRIIREQTNALEDVIPDACVLVDKILEVLDKRFPSFPERVTV